MSDLAARVIAWQRRLGRHALPWQGTRDPYRVWLSEIMLQQTQVATVLGYYPRFLERFPDVQTLAAASVDDVLALWSGLGYYSRARNLHRCAQQVVARHGGVFPASSQALAALPGIGRSTAAAIAVFCHGERAAILDGNVKRVLGRAMGHEADLATAAGERQLWQRAEDLLPDAAIESYTQGLMDLGAGICSVSKPRCDACPLADLCVAHREGRPEAYPVKTRKLRRGRRAHALLWLEQAAGSAVWLVRRPEQGVWAGLWSLPEFESLSALQSLAGHWPGDSHVLPTIKHALTHFDWQLTPLRHRLPEDMDAGAGEAIAAVLGTGRWVAAGEWATLGLPAPVRQLMSSVP